MAMRTYRTAAGWLLTVGPLLLVGCKPIRFDFGLGRPAKDPLPAWVAGDMVHLTDRTTAREDPSLFDARQRRISLFAGANETVSFQLVIDPGPGGAKGVKLSWSDLTTAEGAKLPAASVRAFRMLPITVRDHPAWYLRLVESVPAPAGVYDPLVPVDTAPDGPGLDVDPNGRLAVWIDLAVPRGAEPGEYAGTLTASSRTHKDWTVTLAAEVYAFVLPDARAVPAIGGFDHRELFRHFLKRNGKPFEPVYLDRGSPMVRRGLLLIRKLMRLAHRHRVDLFDVGIRPIMKRTDDGGVRLQWDDYDAIVGPYLTGTAFEDRIGVAAWPIPFSQDWPNPQYYDGASSDVYARTVGSLLKACREHFAGDLKADRQAFLWPCRHLGGPRGYETHARLAGLARRADPNTPILCQLPPVAPARSGWKAPAGFRALIDILAPRAETLDPAVAASAGRTDHPLPGVWLAPGTPPYLPALGLIAKPADVRAVPWFALKYQCSGLFLPNVLHWSGDPFAPVAGAETRLFYPGSIAGLDEPLPSVRLKRLRRGLQDIAYLWILRKRRRPGILHGAMNSLVRYAGLAAAGDNYLDARLDGWAPEGATWVLARRVLAAEVQAAVTPEAAARTETLAHRLAWRRLTEQTRTLKVEQVRTTVAPAPGRQTTPPERLRVTVLLDLYNQFGRAVDADARFARLPRDWTALAGAPIGKVPPASRKVARLEAEGPAPLPTGADGRALLSIRLQSDAEDDREVPAAVPFLVVGRAKKPPRIDGLLNDWPMRVGNTARGFRLIGRRGRRGAGLAKRQTMVFLLRDEATLYIAFRCEEPNPSGVVKHPNNRVHYEQLMACGEDLVEMLFDPGGKARGPEDLLHVIVKPNGVLIAERGIGCEPPLGRTEPWSPLAAVAIAGQDGAWTLELAIPLAAFGPDGQEPFWRANFTRYATQGAEASSWSGAPRYFYDPRNLGTMFLGAVAEKEP